jgi:hypothetical protein
MFSASKLTVAAGLACALAAVAGSPALAGCKRMAFSVNDYGKDGPTKDSQDLLDKHIATWAAEQGIEKFTVGKKETTCELFLNLIVVDEHTCTTRATVCWGGDKLPTAQQAKAAPKDTPAKPAEKAGEKSAEVAKTADTPKASAAAASPAPAATDAVAKQVETKPAGEKAPEAKPSDTANADAKAAAVAVETGTIPLTNKAADPVAPPKSAETGASENIAVSDRDAVSAAAAAAERAADAAERAAAAAERAVAAMEKVAADAAKSQSAHAVASEKPPASTPASPIVAPVQPAPGATKP